MRGYHIFNGIKKHFNTDSYDYFKYNKQVRISNQKYNVLSNKYHYQKLEKHHDPEHLVLSNVIINKSLQIEELWQNQSQQIYNKWKRRNDAFVSQYIPLLLKNNSHFNQYSIKELFFIKKSYHPTFLILYLNNTIPLEVFVAFDRWLDFSKYWNKYLKDDFMWDDVKTTSSKYVPFFNHNQQKLNDIFQNHFQNDINKIVK